MTLRPLILDQIARDKIRRVCDYAKAHALPIDALRQMIAGTLPPAGDNPARTCLLFYGYRCVFTVEEQPFGWARHLSVSVLGNGTAPSPQAVGVLMEEFGFRGTVESCANKSYIETLDGSKVAINVIEELNPS